MGTTNKNMTNYCWVDRKTKFLREFTICNFIKHSVANLTLYARKLQLQSHKYKQFTNNFDSRIVIYEHKMFIRLATDWMLNIFIQSIKLNFYFLSCRNIFFEEIFPMKFDRIFLSHKLQQFLKKFQGCQTSFSNYLNKWLGFGCLEKHLNCLAASS